MIRRIRERRTAILLSILIAMSVGALFMYGFGERRKAHRRAIVFGMLSECIDRDGGAYWEWQMDGQEVAWSPGLRKMWGVDEKWVSTYDAWLATLVPEDREHVDRVCTQVAAEGGAYVVRYKISTPQGIRAIRESGVADKSIGLMVGVCRLEDERPPEQLQLSRR